MKYKAVTLIMALALICSGRLSAQILLYTSGSSVYSVNYTTGSTSLIVSLPGNANASGIVQATNGTVYVGNDQTGMIYQFTLPNPDLTPFATLSQGVEGLAADSSGNVFAGGSSGGVFMISTSGSVSQLANPGQAQFGIAIDPEDNVYAASFAQGGTTSYISETTLSGSTTILAHIDGANGVAYSDGYLYVAATGNSSIEEIDLSDDSVTTFSIADTKVPFSVTANSAGTIFAFDGTFSNSSTDLVSFTESGSIATQTSAPDGFYVTSEVTAVPEPASVPLVALIGAAIFIRLKRRAKADGHPAG